MHNDFFFAHSGDSETDEPSETENNDSGDKTELETTKRLKELKKCINFIRSQNRILHRSANIIELFLIY